MQIPEKHQLILTDTNKSKLTDISLSVKKNYDNDNLYYQLPDLVNQKFRPWYCKVFYHIGRDEVLKLASIARADATNSHISRKLFSKLLKESYARSTQT